LGERSVKFRRGAHQSLKMAIPMLAWLHRAMPHNPRAACCSAMWANGAPNPAASALAPPHASGQIGAATGRRLADGHQLRPAQTA
jgi:hypothetical protein